LAYPERSRSPVYCPCAQIAGIEVSLEMDGNYQKAGKGTT
jgi:hypothetical protein